MSGGVTGNFSQLRALQERLAKLPATAASVATSVAPKVTDDLRAKFDAHESPYGNAWRDGKHGPVTLYKSGALRSGLSFRAIGTAIRCVLGVAYARYQIFRGLLPAGGSPLPAQWGKIISDEATKQITARVTGARV